MILDEVLAGVELQPSPAKTGGDQASSGGHESLDAVNLFLAGDAGRIDAEDVTELDLVEPSGAFQGPRR